MCFRCFRTILRMLANQEWRVQTRYLTAPASCELQADIILDGYDLPPALRDWLYPPNGSTRDFASLQVVFGRGEEYFASDKNGKLEFKEPEVKKIVEDEEKSERQLLRRSRTVSFLRPLSETSVRSEGSAVDSIRSRRSESISSQRASRPPSLSWSRTNSDVSVLAQAMSQGQSVASGRSTAQSSLVSQWELLGSSATNADSAMPSTEVEISEQDQIGTKGPRTAATTTEVLQQPSWSRQLRRSTTQPADTRTNQDQPEMRRSVSPDKNILPQCTCGCHDVPLQPRPKPTYTDSSMQTDPTPSPPRTALRIDTTTPSYPSLHSHSAVSQEVPTPTLQNNPVFMGRMLDYFSKPGYQLGDSLSSGYHDHQAMIYQFKYTYQDEFGDEALR
jgi:hypothetical protein